MVETVFNKDVCSYSIVSYVGTVYGKGVYFATDARYSANDRYSPRDYHKRKHVFLAQVLTGDYDKGFQQYIHPPIRNSETDLYDSCVDDMFNPAVFVIFYDSQAYPEYLIIFT